MVDRAGQQLGSYRLIRLLGRGGFAEVYLGEHIRLNSYAAVKVLNTQIAGSEAESFQREAYTIARLLHPHIIRVFDYDIAEGIPFLVMDYAPNGTLRNRHAKGTPIPLVTIVSYAKQVADALHYAHSERVIHRDIKPENMLIGRNDEILLSDFGIATMSQSSRYQNTLDIVGTVAYMSPEQIQGKPHPASDQYSLGIVIYEWLSGERPFHGSFTEIAVQQVVAPLPPLHVRVPGISPAIEQVVQIALAKDPHQRFASVQAFANAFEQACVSKPSLDPASTFIAMPPVNHVQSPVTEAAVTNYPTSPGHEESATGVNPTVLQDNAVPKADLSPASTGTTSESTRLVSRRAVVVGLGALVVAGGGIAALLASGLLGVNAKPPAPSPGPVQPTQPINNTPTTVPSTPTPTPTSPASPTPRPIISSWSQLPSLPSPEADNVIIYVPLQQRDYIYMTGGYRGKNQSPWHDDALYRYDIAAAQWEVVTNNFPGMFNNAVVRDEQNTLYFTGGYSPGENIVTTLLYMYQPDTGVLQKIVPPGSISFGYGGSMIADQQGHLYLSQGFMKVVNTHTSARTGWYRYDIATNQWQILAPLPQGVAYAVLASDDQGSIVLMGGVTDTEQNYGTTAIYRYSIAQNYWYQEQVAAPQAFNGAASCSIGNGQVVIVGGYNPTQNATLSNTWLVDLGTLNFMALAALPGGGSRLGAAACDQAGNVYLVRGVIGDPHYPAQDFWGLRIRQ